MNRIRKFRAWDTERRHWQYFTLLQLAQGEAHLLWSKLESWCEFTGLLDKDGNDIYERDVVRITYLPDDSFEVSQVEWWDIVTGFGDRNAKSIGYYHRKFDQFSIKVVGNAHEHPDLLEEKTTPR